MPTTPAAMETEAEEVLLAVFLVEVFFAKQFVDPLDYIRFLPPSDEGGGAQRRRERFTLVTCLPRTREVARSAGGSD